ncbi:LysR family transcriptional regulator [uncultured Turicimonas sp.]|uniref:LysR family transcriptional regulator n=1 Tax=uncultured Turicimonas sp. TaxID=1918607 RepID=UPI00280581CF|nr:LysR family transcriptional regulator [uncultured Turicimonas sp.]
MADDIESWEIFVSLYKTGSIGLTAQELNVDAPTVSKKISVLEKKLGRCLFDRRSRPFAPTVDAVEIYDNAREIVNHRKKISAFISDKQNENGAIIRVMQGNSYRRYAAALAFNYQREHPNLRFNFVSPIDIQDFLDRKADLIAISGEINLPNCVFLSRGRMIFIPVASPNYLKENGPLDHPKDLTNHYVFSNGFIDRFSSHLSYPFKKKDRLWTMTVTDRIRCSNVEFSKTAALQGLGVCPSLPLFCCIDELEAGTLVPILDGWHRPSVPNYVVCRREDWKLKYFREFATWYADQQKDIQCKCEERLVKVFGQDFLDNLAEN